MIKTGSWFTTLPADHIKIGISRGQPRRGVSGYRMYRKLAPGAWFNSVPVAEYISRYDAEVLARLDPREVLAEILRLAGDKIPVLCCFERVGGPDWCHRALAAAWLAEGLGIAVPELGHEQLEQNAHPMLPQELLV